MRATENVEKHSHESSPASIGFAFFEAGDLYHIRKPEVRERLRSCDSGDAHTDS